MTPIKAKLYEDFARSYESWRNLTGKTHCLSPLHPQKVLMITHGKRWRKCLEISGDLLKIHYDHEHGILLADVFER